MSKQMITLTPSTRKANRDAFVKANPWTPGKTIAEIKALVEAGTEQLKGGFTFPEEENTSTKAKAPRKSATPTQKANVKAKTGKAPAKKKAAKVESAFHAWLVETAEARKTRKKVNKKAAKFLHSIGVHPQGQAWVEVHKGERDPLVLQALNDKDGFNKHPNRVTEPVKATKKASKPVVKVAQVVAEIDPQAPARPRVHRSNGAFMNKAQQETYYNLVDSGLDATVARKAAEVLA